MTGGIEVPTINLGTKSKPKPYILHLMMAEMIGLNKNGLNERVKRMPDVESGVRITRTAVVHGKSTQAQELACLPIGKFEVLINTIDTARIGNTLSAKDRKALVTKIETVQREIRSVIEAYYHDGVAINEKVSTKHGRGKMIGHVRKNASAKELAAMRDALDAAIEQRDEESLLRQMSEENLREVCKSLWIEAKDVVRRLRSANGRTALAKRKKAIHKQVRSANNARYAEDWGGMAISLIQVVRLGRDASQKSHSYKDTAMTGLRRDVRDLKKRMSKMEGMLYSQQDVLQSQQHSINGLVVSVGKIVEHLGIGEKVDESTTKKKPNLTVVPK